MVVLAAGFGILAQGERLTLVERNEPILACTDIEMQLFFLTYTSHFQSVLSTDARFADLSRAILEVDDIIAEFIDAQTEWYGEVLPSMTRCAALMDFGTLWSRIIDESLIMSLMLQSLVNGEDSFSLDEIDDRAVNLNVLVTELRTQVEEMGERIEDDDTSSSACTITGSNVNLRRGPGTNYDLAGALTADQSFTASGQARGADGVVWYQLENGAWARSDIVTAEGDCASVPTVAAPPPPPPPPTPLPAPTQAPAAPPPPPPPPPATTEEA
jgi:hypothetical protein